MKGCSSGLSGNSWLTQGTNWAVLAIMEHFKLLCSTDAKQEVISYQFKLLSPAAEPLCLWFCCILCCLRCIWEFISLFVVSPRNASLLSLNIFSMFRVLTIPLFILFSGDLWQYSRPEQDYVLAASHQRCISCRGGLFIIICGEPVLPKDLFKTVPH